jgi:hypothetical protein
MLDFPNGGGYVRGMGNRFFLIVALACVPIAFLSYAYALKLLFAAVSLWLWAAIIAAHVVTALVFASAFDRR